MSGSPNRLINIAHQVLLVVVLLGPLVQAQNPTIRPLIELIQQENLADAVQVARRLDEDSAIEVNLTLPLAALARALQRAGEIEQSAEFYQRAVTASETSAATPLPAKSLVVLRLAAGTAIAQSKRFRNAIATVTPVFESDGEVTDKQRQMAVNVCLQVGGRALATGNAAIAGEAYAVALHHANESARSTALLGDAWVAVLKRDQPLVAAEKLSAFCQQFPAHVDAPKAWSTSIECYRRAGQQQNADHAVAQLLEDWPDSTAAIAAVRLYQNQAVDLIPDAVQSWLIQKANDDDVNQFDTQLCVVGILTANRLNEPAAITNLLRQLTKLDQEGHSTNDLLSRLPSADAERIAIKILCPDDPALSAAGDSSDLPSTAAREATARWAAGKDRWSMLASAAEVASPDDPDGTCSAPVEQLFAEALTQVGRLADAKQWWDHLVDQRSQDDFATLLRCAEAETAAGDDTQLAQRRINAARDAAGDHSLHLALADLLEAELQVRRTKFVPARQRLESVAHANDVDASIRARAQWLIGETYYLQQNFAAAIDAYRQVEEIAGETTEAARWISAALVQAGKSFEQLGRTRAAALCYGNLLDRFPDSAHARLASQRMAAIEPQRPGDAPNSSQTIRR